MTPAHRALRERTSEAHERVDSAFGGYELSDRSSYAAMLRAHLEALMPYEASLTGWQGQSALLADWEERRRLPALLDDIRSYAKEDPYFWQPAPLLEKLVAEGRTFDDLNKDAA